MIFTLYYMYATFLQWWRLGALKNKLNGTLNTKNALLLGDERVIYETKKKRSFENLLFRNDNRIGATIIPKSKLNLSSQWVVFPRDVKFFPIFFDNHKITLESPHVYVWIQAVLDSYTKHHSEILQLETYGEPVAWKVTEYFELILKTDMDKLTKIVHCFSQSNCDINHELQVLKIETVDVEGKAKRIPFERQYSTESTMKYSYRPVHWGNFVYEVKQLYSKVRDATNPKIKIDNGSVKSEDLNKKVPVSEVKPIKKDKKHSDKHAEDKNTLEVNSSDYRRHKSNHHVKKESDRSSERYKTEKTKKEGRENSPKGEKVSPKDDSKNKELKKNKLEKITHDVETKTNNKSEKKEDLEKPLYELEAKIETKVDTVVKPNGVSPHEAIETNIEATSENQKVEEKVKEKHHIKEHKEEKKEHKKDHKRDRKESDSKGSVSKSGSKETYSRSSSKEKKLVRSSATTDEPETSSKVKKFFRSREKPEEKRREKFEEKKREKSEEKRREKHKYKTEKHEKSTVESKSEKLENKDSSCSNIAEEPLTPSDFSGSLVDQDIFKTVKPPNILVYADSLVAKENVKKALRDILNKEKYTIYDLPVSNQTHWSGSTVLVVVCGTVDTKLTSSLMKYMLNGGQLLCLCSDFLYSVLHTFTTAEVREHELVTFSYGQWQNVKMMHSLFCYQASPAKKQFSKDSDASNHSSGNGSSPIAPRTPSAVQIQHNGREFTIQVQVLGTEETWQTPSLLLASVKGSRGRAVFSQVHLEIDPSQYEADEGKFETLKGSDLARLEILKDILTKQLELDCSSRIDHSVTYTPAYFLGRHDLKLKMLQECPSIKESKVSLDDLNLTFVGKDQQHETPSKSFLPVLIHACPTNFSTVSYFETLESKYVGRLVLYSDVLESSFKLLSGCTFANGLAVICRQQTAGVGRSNNTWLSPLGSALLSLQLHIPTNSSLAKTLPIIQHMSIIAVVSAIKKLTQYDQRIDIGIKWPNDLYAFKSVKIGGLIVTSTCCGDLTVANIGCGVNLNNQNPTVCINQMIRGLNAEHGTSIPEISLEAYMASVCNEIERLVEMYQTGHVDDIFEFYYKYWLHNNSTVVVTSKDGTSQKAKVVGIDDYGFLKIQTNSGKISTVTPDGNTFDMMKGLIYPKSF